MRRLVLLLLFALAIPAAASDPVFDEASRKELVAALAEATEVQKVCYGYDLRVDDDSGGGWGGFWGASNLGVDVDPRGDAACPNYVVLHAGIAYTSDSSEDEDNASWDIESTFASFPTKRLKRLGLDADALTSDGSSDKELYNAVLALPVLVADAGLAPPVTEAADNVERAPADAVAANQPGSDWWRENVGTFATLLIGLAVAALWASATTPKGHRVAKVFWKILRD